MPNVLRLGSIVAEIYRHCSSNTASGILSNRDNRQQDETYRFVGLVRSVGAISRNSQCVQLELKAMTGLSVAVTRCHYVLVALDSYCAAGAVVGQSLSSAC